MTGDQGGSNPKDQGRGAGKFLGSLREALAAASREEAPRSASSSTPAAASPAGLALPPPLPIAKTPEAVMSQPPAPAKPASASSKAADPGPSAAEAAREARAGSPLIPPERADRHVEMENPPTTRIVRGGQRAASSGSGGPAKTELLRGKRSIKHQDFHQDPVVGWLVIIGGPGLGAYHPIFEGNNTVGRAANQRISIDFGDDSISAEEQAYIRYDGVDRTFLFVPNLAKTNVVAVNDKKPTQAVALSSMDLITMGRTQLVFVPFCGPDFDWSELAGVKG